LSGVKGRRKGDTDEQEGKRKGEIDKPRDQRIGPTPDVAGHDAGNHANEHLKARGHDGHL
jgi:hypothetical protein